MQELLSVKNGFAENPGVYAENRASFVQHEDTELCVKKYVKKYIVYLDIQTNYR